MGYYTHFNLSITLDQYQKPEKCLKCGMEANPSNNFCPNCGNAIRVIDSESIIGHLRSENEDAEYALTSTGEAADGVKWYDARAQIAEFSKKYPNALFRLEGSGEENGDIWTFYAKNGEGQFERAKIIVDPYDPKKMSPQWIETNRDGTRAS